MRDSSQVNNHLQSRLESVVEVLEKDIGIDAVIKVGVHDLRTGMHAYVRPESTGWAASIIKVPIMVAALQQIEQKRLSFDTKIPVNHAFNLEPADAIALLPDRTPVDVETLLYYMIKDSDNTATNMIADRVGIDTINTSMWQMGMKYSMLGHLLYPKAPRTGAFFNPDGSNLTCVSDMVRIMRHIYDPSTSSLSNYVRNKSDYFLSATNPLYIRHNDWENVKSKVGTIHDQKDGSDIHETAIVDNHLIVSIMMNKIGQRSIMQKQVQLQKDCTVYNYVPLAYRAIVSRIARNFPKR